MTGHKATATKKQIDIVTPHRLTVAILIREFQKIRESDNCFQALPEQIKRKYICDFSIFNLKLIQSPDVGLEELMNTLSNNNFAVHTNLMRKFENTICSISEVGVRFLQDVVDSIGQMTIPLETLTSTPLTNRTSVVGFYLRRLVTSFDRLTFSEVTLFLEAYKKYSSNLVKDAENFSMSMSNKQKSSIGDDWQERCQWSRRQAELFIATQANLLTNNEEKALNPKELNNNITSLLKANYDLSEAHFLSYLNYLRVKEFCASLENIYQCFDKSVGNEGRGTADERTKGYRYAALNLAILQFQFGNRKEARTALEEAVKVAQEAGDNICLQNALAWMYCIVPDQRYKLIEHSILKSLELDLTYIMSLGIQAFVQQFGLTRGNPVHIFETMTKSDIVSQHIHSDLTSSSYAQKAALWEFYGKSEISSLLSQLLLHANTDNSSFSTHSKVHYGEGYCLAICNTANQMLAHGEYAMTNAILSFAKKRFPHEPNSQHWMFCEYLLHFIINLHHEDYLDAEVAAQKLAIFDKNESLLRLAELYIQKQNYKEAVACVCKVLDNTDDMGMLRTDHQIRAMILMIDAQIASCGNDMVIPGLVVLLHSAIRISHDYHLDYLLAMVHLRVAHIQLLMGLPAQALFTFERCLVQILGHGGCFDRARAMFLYVNCVVANAGHLTDKERYKTIADGIQLLKKVKDNFLKAEAYHRVKDVLYMQGLLYNEINLISQRNECSMEYRILDEEHPSKNRSTLLKLL